MKQLLAGSLLTLFSFFATAQDQPSRRVRFGLTTGINSSKFLVSSPQSFYYIDEDPTAKAALNAGLLKIKTHSANSLFFGFALDIPVSKMLSLQSGITLMVKQCQFSMNDKITYKTSSFTDALLYLQIPLNLVTKMYVSPKGGYLFAGAGPYWSFTAGGVRYITYSNGSTTDVSLETGTEESYYKSKDWGLNGVVGYQFRSGFNLQAGYDLGLTDISNRNNSSVKTRNFKVGLGYFF